MDFGGCSQLSVEHLDLIEHSRPRLQQRLDQTPDSRRGAELASDEFVSAFLESAHGPAEQYSEGSQQPSDLVL